VAVLASLPGSVGYLAAGLPAGVLVDRLDPWATLICADVIRAVIFLALYLLTGTHVSSAWLLPGGNPRPVFAAAGGLTLVTVAVAWLAGLRKQRHLWVLSKP
jgi:hypothetical protein